MRYSIKSLAFLNRQFMNKKEQKIHILPYKIIATATFSLYKAHKTNHKPFIILSVQALVPSFHILCKHRLIQQVQPLFHLPSTFMERYLWTISP